MRCFISDQCDAPDVRSSSFLWDDSYESMKHSGADPYLDRDKIMIVLRYMHWEWCQMHWVWCQMWWICRIMKGRILWDGSNEEIKHNGAEPLFGSWYNTDCININECESDKEDPMHYAAD